MLSGTLQLVYRIVLEVDLLRLHLYNTLHPRRALHVA